MLPRQLLIPESASLASDLYRRPNGQIDTPNASAWKLPDRWKNRNRLYANYKRSRYRTVLFCRSPKRRLDLQANFLHHRSNFQVDYNELAIVQSHQLSSHPSTEIRNLNCHTKLGRAEFFWNEGSPKASTATLFKKPSKKSSALELEWSRLASSSPEDFD